MPIQPDCHHQSPRTLLASFFSWVVVIVGGFAYVSGVLCHRSNPFHSGNGSSADLLLILLASPLLFYLGPRHNWRPVNASAPSLLRWNGLCYFLPFFLALHWQFVGDILGVGFSLKASHLESLDTRATVVLGAACLAILGLVILHLIWAAQQKILFVYLAAIFGIPCFVGIINLYLGDAYYLHVHHYCVGALLFPFFRFRKVTSFVAQAIFLGLAVEGISHWGADPWWYPLP